MKYPFKVIKKDNELKAIPQNTKEVSTIMKFCNKKKINILKKLEYRGYDSAGISLFEKNRIRTIKSIGKISELEKKSKKFSDKNFYRNHRSY